MDIVFHPLALPITLPFLAGLVCLLLPGRLDKAREVIAVAGERLAEPAVVQETFPLRSLPDE